MTEADEAWMDKANGKQSSDVQEMLCPNLQSMNTQAKKTKQMKDHHMHGTNPTDKKHDARC